MCSTQPCEPVLLQWHPLCCFSSSCTEVLARSPARQASRKLAMHFPALLPGHCSVPLLAINCFPPRRTLAFGTLYISLITRSYFSVH